MIHLRHARVPRQAERWHQAFRSTLFHQRGVLIGAMIDDYWEDGTDPQFAPFRFKVPWGNGIWHSIRDIAETLSRSPPDWDAFLGERHRVGFSILNPDAHGAGAVFVWEVL